MPPYCLGIMTSGGRRNIFRPHFELLSKMSLLAEGKLFRVSCQGVLKARRINSQCVMTREWCQHIRHVGNWGDKWGHPTSSPTHISLFQQARNTYSLPMITKKPDEIFKQFFVMKLCLKVRGQSAIIYCREAQLCFEICLLPKSMQTNLEHG